MNLVANYPEEGKRLQFLFERDGLTGAARFSDQTLRLYSIAVTERRPPCKNYEYRIKYKAAIVDFKRFNALYSVTNTMRHYV